MQNFRSIVEGTNIEAKLRKEFPEVRFNCEENDKSFKLLILVVQHKRRRKGEGQAFMTRLIQLANELNKKIELTPDDSYSLDGDMDLNQLTDWYKSFGFKKSGSSYYK